MSKSSKGATWEREFSKKLSSWWTCGERDDVFWRSTTSGARATTRAKQGLATSGQYGDIATQDPIGQPMLDTFTIELKRGYSKDSIQSLFDARDGAAVQPYAAFLDQTITSATQAGTPHWMLVVKRDRRVPLVMTDYPFFLRWKKWSRGYTRIIPEALFRLPNAVTVHCTRLDDWLACVAPDDIRRMLG